MFIRSARPNRQTPRARAASLRSGCRLQMDVMGDGPRPPHSVISPIGADRADCDPSAHREPPDRSPSPPLVKPRVVAILIARVPPGGIDLAQAKTATGAFKAPAQHR